MDFSERNRDYRALIGTITSFGWWMVVVSECWLKMTRDGAYLSRL